MAHLPGAGMGRGDDVRHLGVERVRPGRLVGQRAALEVLQDLHQVLVEGIDKPAVTVGDRSGDGDATVLGERGEERQVRSRVRPADTPASGELHEPPAGVGADRHVAPRIDPVGDELEPAGIELVAIPEETDQGLPVDVRLRAHPPTLRSPA
jgi:hypothetical protein